MGVFQQLHSHHLFASSWGLRSVGVFAPAFLPAEGASGAGDGAEGLVAGGVVEACLQGCASFIGGDGVFPSGRVEDECCAFGHGFIIAEGVWECNRVSGLGSGV